MHSWVLGVSLRSGGTGSVEPLSFPSTERTNQGTGLRHYLGVLIDFGDILLIAVDVQSNGGPCTPSAT